MNDDQGVKPPYITCSYCGKNIPVRFSGMATTAIHRESCIKYLEAEALEDLRVKMNDHH